MFRLPAAEVSPLRVEIDARDRSSGGVIRGRLSLIRTPARPTTSPQVTRFNGHLVRGDFPSRRRLVFGVVSRIRDNIYFVRLAASAAFYFESGGQISVVRSFNS